MYSQTKDIILYAITVYILALCQYMTIKEVAKHLGLDWKTVKEIHKQYLKEKFSHEDRGYPKLLAVDEISLKKRHHYLTLIINWEVGRVLWVGEGRKYETLKDFFDSLTEQQRSSIQASEEALALSISEMCRELSYPVVLYSWNEKRG